MNPDEKKIILNRITNASVRLEQNLKKFANLRSFGLQKGKPALAEIILNDCDDLAEALSVYLSDRFTLSDIQND